MLDILGILDEKGIPYLHKGGDEWAIVCPAQHLHQGGSDSKPSFDINIAKEVGSCMSCGYRLNQAGLYSFLMGEELDDLHLKGLAVRSILARLAKAEQANVIDDVSDFFFPMGEPWQEDGYRNISLRTYQELGAVKVTRGRYQNRIAFPVYVNGALAGVDARYLGNDKEDKVAKYLRNKDSTCKHNWLFPYDRVKAMKPSMVLLGEGLFHGINAYDKGFPGLAYFGVNNWSNNKVMMLLATGASEVCYVPDPDKAGYQAAQRICAALTPWFAVTVADIFRHQETGKDLGDLTREEIEEAVAGRGKPVLPLCLLRDWEAKIVYGVECKERKCPFNHRGECNNPTFEAEWVIPCGGEQDYPG